MLLYSLLLHEFHRVTSVDSLCTFAVDSFDHDHGDDNDNDRTFAPNAPPMANCLLLRCKRLIQMTQIVWLDLLFDDPFGSNDSMVLLLLLWWWWSIDFYLVLGQHCKGHSIDENYTVFVVLCEHLSLIHVILV